jgi:hypothetical protein
MLAAVKAFNPYDLYSKSDDAPNVKELKVCYLQIFKFSGQYYTSLIKTADNLVL